MGFKFIVEYIAQLYLFFQSRLRLVFTDGQFGNVLVSFFTEHTKEG